LGTIGGFDGSEKCSIGNFQVECIEWSSVLCRRDIVDSSDEDPSFYGD